MKKIEFIETIQARLPVKLHGNTIAIFIGRAWNTVIYETFKKDFANLDIYTTTYSNVPVSYDSAVAVYYSAFPVSIIQLPISGDGILSIGSMQGKGIEFVPVKAGMQDIHNGLEVGTLNGPIPYYIMNGRIEYANTGGIDTISAVRIRAIPQFEALANTDDFYFPVGSDERIMELVTQFAIGATPTKETNDENNKTP